MIYLLHKYCIFARYSYDILVNYICFFLFIINILYCQLNYNRDVWYILWVKLHGIVRDVCFSMVRYVLGVVLKCFFWYSYFCIGPKHFFNIMHFVCMASHITCTFCSEFCINCHVYMSMCLYSLQFLHFVLCWNAWWKLWMK